MKIFYEQTSLVESQPKVPFLPKDYEADSDWLVKFSQQNFREPHLVKQFSFLIANPLYGKLIKNSLLRVHLLENLDDKKQVIADIQPLLYQRPWVVVTNLLKILARPKFDDERTQNLYLLRESIIDKLALKNTSTLVHQYIRFYDEANKLKMGVMPLINEKHMVVAKGELPDKRIQELLTHEAELYSDEIANIFLLINQEDDLNDIKALLYSCIRNMGAQFIVLSIYKILNQIPLNQIEANFIANKIELRKYIFNLIELIVHTQQLDKQKFFIEYFWQTPCFKQEIFDYLSDKNISLFVRWLLDNKLIDKNFTIYESSLIEWALEKGDYALFSYVYEPSEKITDNQKISAVYSGNLDICKTIFRNSTPTQLEYFLSQAIKSNHLDLVQWFFEQGVRPVLKQDALFALAKNKNFIMIEAILKFGLKPHPSMIIRLIEAHDHELLGYILTYYSDELLKFKFKGLTLWDYLLEKQNLEFLELLLQHDVDYEIRPTVDLNNLCRLAISSNCQLLAKKLFSLQKPSSLLLKLAQKYHQIDSLKFIIIHYGLRDLVDDENEFLNWVANHGFYQLIEPILQQNPSLLKTSSKALVLASQKGKVNSVKRLIDLGADVNFCDETGETALTWSAYEGFARVLKCLLEVDGIDVNHKNHAGLSAINNSILQKNCKIANMLLQHGATYNDQELAQLLELACIKNNTQLFTTVMDKNKGQIDITAEHIWLAINYNAHEILELLLTKNQTINLASQLVYAIDIGKLAIVKILKEKGADLNQVFPDGKTPLIIALQGHHHKVINYLLDNHVDVDISWHGKSALDFAIEKKNSKAILKIIQKTARPIEQLSVYLPTIILMRERFPIYQALIHKGLDLSDIPMHDREALLETIIKHDDAQALAVFLKDEQLKQVIDLAARYQSLQCFQECLKVFQPLPNWQDNTSCSPLIWAIRHQNLSMVSFLSHQFSCQYLGNSPINFAVSLKNFEILKILFQKQGKHFNSHERQQVTLGLLQAAHEKKLKNEDKLLLNELLQEIPLETDLWGNSVLDYCDEPKIEVQVLKQSADLSIFKAKVLERCFKRFMKEYPKHLELMKKLVLHQPELLTLCYNQQMIETIFDKKSILSLEALLQQLEPNIKLETETKKQMRASIEKIKALKHQYAIDEKPLVDLNAFKAQLVRFIKLKKLDEFIHSVLSSLGQQNLVSGLFFCVSNQIKKIKSIYDNLSPEERLAYFEPTATLDDATNPLLQALREKSFQWLYPKTSTASKNMTAFRKMIQLQRLMDK